MFSEYFKYQNPSLSREDLLVIKINQVKNEQIVNQLNDVLINLIN